MWSAANPREVYPQSFPRFALQNGHVKLIGLMRRLSGIAGLTFGMNCIHQLGRLDLYDTPMRAKSQTGP